MNVSCLAGLLVSLAGGLAAQGPTSGRLPAGPAQGPVVRRSASTADPARSVAVPRTQFPPKIDGVLDDALWQSAPRLTGFTQYEPNPGTTPDDSTIGLVAYDEHRLYVAVIAHGEPRRMRASITPRDQANIGEGDDGITLRLDTFNDSRRAYVIQVNPRGVQQDGTIREGTDETERDEDFVWTAAAKINHDGYVIEIAIPFTSLTFPSANTFDIGFNIFRHYAPGVRHDAWYPRKRGHPCDICQQGLLTGITNVATRQTVDVRPYVMAAQGRERPLDEIAVPWQGETWDAARPGTWRTRDTERRAGADVRLALTRSFEVNATLHPDFSQIEASPEQIRVNRRFALFYDEKRPFFTTGADAFSTAAGGVGSLGQLFYSRDIVDPSVGARLSGKAGRLTVAGLYAHDSRPAYYFYDGYESSDVDASAPGSADIAVLRARRDISDDSYVGILASRRQHGDGFSQVAGLDTRFRLDRFTLVFDGFVSSDRVPIVTQPLDGQGGCPAGYSAISGRCRSNIYGGDRTTGSLVRTRLDFYSEHLGVVASMAQVSPDFRDQLGTIGRVGIRRYGAWIGLSQFPRRFGLSEVELELDADFTEAYETGASLDYSIQPTAQLRWIHGSSFEVGPSFSRNTFLGQSLTTSRMQLEAGLRIAKGLYVSSEVSFGEQVIYDFGAPRVGRGVEAGVTMWIRPFPAFFFQPSYKRETTSEANGGQTITKADLFSLTTEYQRSPRLGFRLYTQFSDQSSDLETNPFDRREGYVRSSFLVRYELVPTSFLFFGINDEYQRFEAPVTATSGYTRTGLRVFFKASYLVRL